MYSLPDCWKFQGNNFAFIAVFPDSQYSLRSLWQDRMPVAAQAMAKPEHGSLWLLVLGRGVGWW